MQGFILPDITATKKCTLILGSTSNFQLLIIYMYFGENNTSVVFLKLGKKKLKKRRS